MIEEIYTSLRPKNLFYGDWASYNGFLGSAESQKAYTDNLTLWNIVYGTIDRVIDKHRRMLVQFVRHDLRIGAEPKFQLTSNNGVIFYYKSSVHDSTYMYREFQDGGTEWYLKEVGLARFRGDEVENIIGDMREVDQELYSSLRELSEITPIRDK